MEAALGPLATALTSILPVLYVLAAGIGLDFATGVWAAWKSGSLNPEFFPTFFTSNVLKKAVPILLGLVAGLAVAPTSPEAAAPIIAVAGGAAAAYLAALVNSIVGNIQEGQAGVKVAPTSVELNAAVVPVAEVDDVASPEDVV